MLQFELGIAHIVSALSGFAVSTAFILKLVKDVESLIQKLEKNSVELTGISAKLEAWDRGHDLISVHDRKIAALENEVYGVRGSRS
jgi:hypothetical protein